MSRQNEINTRLKVLHDVIDNIGHPAHKVSLGDTNTDDGFVSSSNPLPIAYADGGQVDAFGRLRVSNPVTQFDSKQLHDNAPLFWDEVDGGGSTAAVHSTADAATTMTVDADGEYIIRQTRMRFNYQPGKSQQILATFVLGAATTEIEKRVGYFNSATTGDYDSGYDGIYLEQDGTTQYIVQAKNGSTTKVAQASWDDPMDGTGASGITVDWAKTQILLIDFEWLGVGRVRVGLVIDGAIYYFHAFNNANSLTSVYMSSPNHSVRYEIRSSGGTASLVHICSSVASEGGEQALGIMQYASTAGTEVTCTSQNVIYAVIGIRLKSAHLDSTVRLLNVAAQIQSASKKIEWLMLFNPTIAGSFTYGAITNSCIEYATGASANTVTNGTAISGGYLESGGAATGRAGSTGSEISNALRLGSGIDGTADQIVLCARPIGGSSGVDIEGGIFWRELS